MRRAGNLQVDASALERGERDVGAWLASLRDLAGGTGYRAAVQREDLVFLAEDAQTKPAVRIAAAVALGAPDDHERARLRIAAAQSASVPLDIAANLLRHLDFIDAAAREQVELLVFPELSLSGYELPGLVRYSNESTLRVTPSAAPPSRSSATTQTSPGTGDAGAND